MIENSLNEKTNEISTLNKNSPWPGLYAYRENDNEFFLGRLSEIENLLRLIMRRRLTVLYGLSGLGKTSLLQAGLFPHLRKKNILPVYIRLDFSLDHPNLIMQVKQAIETEASVSDVEVPEGKDEETLWEYFHTKDADFWNERNRLILPLLVFDQFEEIFTLGRSNPSRANSCDKFLIELGDLIEGRVPSYLKGNLDAHRKNIRQFNFTRHYYNILLSLREDFLPDIEGLERLIPSIKLNSMRLHRMNGDAAFRVVAHADHLIKPDIAEQVVRFVAAEESPDLALQKLVLDPALLSVVCRELNNKREQLEQQYITENLFEGSQEKILAGFYEDSLADLSTEVRTFIEEKLLTDPGNRRDSIALERALQIPGVDHDTIDLLVKRRLIRMEERAGLQRLELTHDLLIGVITDSRDRRRKIEKDKERESQLKKMKNEIEEGRQRTEVERRRAEKEADLRKEAENERLIALKARKAAEKERQNALNEKKSADAARAEALKAKRRASIGFVVASFGFVAAISGIVVMFLLFKQVNEAKDKANKMVSVVTAHRLSLGALEHLKKKNNLESALMARLAFHFARRENNREALNHSTKVLADAIAAFYSPKDRGLLHDPDDFRYTTYKTITLNADGKFLAAAGQYEIDPIDLKFLPVKSSRLDYYNINIIEQNSDGYKESYSFPSIHLLPIQSLAFSPDDELLASGSADKTIILWKFKERKNPFFKKLKLTSGVTSIAFDRDGKWLAFGSTDNTVQLWKISTEQIENFPGKLTHPASMIRFHPDKDVLGFGCEDGIVYLWNFQKNETVRYRHKDIKTPVKALAFSKSRKIGLLASGHEDRSKANARIVLWSQNNPSKYNVLKIDKSATYPLTIKNNILYSGNHSWNLRNLEDNSWDKQELEMKFTGDMVPGDRTISAAFSADGSVVAALFEGVGIIKWHKRRMVQADKICSEVDDFTKEEKIVRNNLQEFNQELIDEISCRKLIRRYTKDEKAGEKFDQARNELYDPEGSYDKAQNLFDEAIKLDPQLVKKIKRELANWHKEKVKDAIDLAYKGKIKVAVRTFSDLEEIDKDHVSAAEWNELCTSGIQFKQYKEIKAACDEAVKLDEKHGGYKGNRGILLAVMAQTKTDLKPAIEDLNKFKEWVPDTRFKEQIDGWIEKLNKVKGTPGDDRLTKGQKDEIQVMLSPPEK